MIVGGDARGVCTRGEPLVGCEESGQHGGNCVHKRCVWWDTPAQLLLCFCAYDAASVCGAWRYACAKVLLELSISESQATHTATDLKADGVDDATDAAKKETNGN